MIVEARLTFFDNSAGKIREKGEAWEMHNQALINYWLRCNRITIPPDLVIKEKVEIEQPKKEKVEIKPKKEKVEKK